MSIANDNLLAAANGGRSYPNVPKETTAQREDRLRRAEIERLRVKLAKVDAAAPKVDASKVYRELR